MNTTAGLSRIVVTIEIDHDPHTDILAVQALLRLTEWLHHQGTTPTRTTPEITSAPDAP